MIRYVAFMRPDVWPPSSRRSGSQLRKVLGKEPDIVVRTVREIAALLESAPFKDVTPDPAVKLYVAFVSRKPKTTPRCPFVSSAEALEVLRIVKGEVFIVSRRKKNGLFGFPNLFIEAQLGVSATTRNWSTVTKFADFAQREAL